MDTTHQLKGMHHVTAITSSAEEIYTFFTYTLGMRLVKKTVNQDDIQTYHLFFADDTGQPGTDMTFFDFPGVMKGVHGTDEIACTSFRVPSDEAIQYWKKRFARLDVTHDSITEQFGKKVLRFADFDGQQYQLISDEHDTGVAAGTPWTEGPIPEKYAIVGLGPAILRVDRMAYFKELLEKLFLYEEIAVDGNVHLFEVGEGGNGAQLIVEDAPDLDSARQGAGTVHHVAFRVADKTALQAWDERIQRTGLRTSGFVERYYFGSLYIPVSSQILFELATDGPGFLEDEAYETLGEQLSLPPFLEPKRAAIEKEVRHIDTVRSTKEFKKE